MTIYTFRLCANIANFCERLMNRMVVMRGRFLDPLKRNRLNATVDVRLSERCGASADTSLSHISPPPPQLFKR